MALNETEYILSEITNITPSILNGGLAPIINIIKTAGIIFIIYVIIMIIQSILKIKDRKRLRRIEEKLDILLKKQKKK